MRLPFNDLDLGDIRLEVGWYLFGDAEIQKA
jgi:hypothetical protein